MCDATCLSQRRACRITGLSLSTCRYDAQRPSADVHLTERQEQESARGSHQGETPGIFIVLSGFATTDLSVRFCDACQGGGAYGKPAAPRPFFSRFLSSSSPYAFVNILRPLAAAERPSVASQ